MVHSAFFHTTIVGVVKFWSMYVAVTVMQDRVLSLCKCGGECLGVSASLGCECADASVRMRVCGCECAAASVFLKSVFGILAPVACLRRVGVAYAVRGLESRSSKLRW